jgi:hypothetical protein
MSKFSGTSITPGQQTLIETPVEKLSEFSSIPFNDNIGEPITMEESVNLSPPIEGEVTSGLNTTETITDDVNIEDLSTDFNVGETPVVEKTTEELLTGAFENPAERESQRVPSFIARAGITSLTPAAITNNVPLQTALLRAINTDKVLNNQLQGRKITANKRAELESGNLEGAFASINKKTGEIITPANPLTRNSNINVGAQAIIYNPEVLGAGVINPETNMMGVDPDLGMIMSMTTEAFLHQSMVETQPSMIKDGDALIADEFQGESGPIVKENIKLTKSKGNEQLGREVYREYQRHKAERQGQPTDSYLQSVDKITPETFVMLGDISKEVYAQANPDMIIRDDSETEAKGGKQGGQVYFEITPLGAITLDKVASSYKGLFAQPEIKPLSTPTIDAQPQYEASQYTRKITTKRGDLKDISLVEQAMNNYNSVAFINDPRREATGNLFGMLALANNDNPNNQTYNNIFSIGNKKFAELEAEKERLLNAAKRIKNEEKRNAALREANAYNPIKILQGEREKFVNIMGAVNRDSQKANYLSYYFQALTGRMAPQQTLYNPSSHKTVRQMTGSGNVYKFTLNQGSELETTWKEIMGALLFEKDGLKGTKLSTPERIKLFNEEAAKSGGRYNQAVSYGNELLAAVNTFDKRTAKETFKVLQQAKTPEEVNQIKAMIKQKFNTDPLSEGLKTELASKKSGEAIHFADYFMDLAKYDAARKSNTPGGQQFSTSITVELDGTTHGPATNAALLGITAMAQRSGLLTTQDYTVLDEIDMRDAMGELMNSKVESLAGSLYPTKDILVYKQMLNLAVLDRENFLKKSPMTMGYGQELESLKMHVETTVFTGPEGKQIRELGEAAGITADKTIEFLHSMLVDSIFSILDPKVVHMGKLMKANALFSSMTNEVLYFENASGFRSYAAGTQTDPELTTQSSYQFEDGIKSEVQFYKSKAEGSAIRGDRGPGSWVSGLIQPVAVQSYDGNMISRTGTGSSWSNITRSSKSLGGQNAFVDPIFDAFLVDLGSFSAVRKESNKNWVESIRNHSYVEKITVDWYKEALQNFNKRIAENPMATIDWTAAKNGEGEYRGLAYLFTDIGTTSPKLALVNAIKNSMQAQPKSSMVSVNDYGKMLTKEAFRITDKVIVPELQANGIDPLMSKTITAREAKIIVDTIQKHLKLQARNSNAAATIKRDVASLMSKVDAEAREARNVDL